MFEPISVASWTRPHLQQRKTFTEKTFLGRLRTTMRSMLRSISRNAACGGVCESVL
jgi:hypothetical protein